ncbi:MAG: TrkH family potassium uptake protein [Treponema sp.]|nr:TrkH family potassium uptake protein [Treponema sp.]
MTIITFLRIISIILSIIGISFAFPIGTALACGEYSVIPSFLIPMLIAIVLGVFGFFFGKKQQIHLSTRNVFLLVSLAWIAISLYGAIPLVLTGTIPSITDAVFESVSGFSTTGATVLSAVEHLPRSVNLWRCEMHWLGGMGIIALTVALLPLLGVGGFQLIKAESTGVDKGKITPKIANTAETLWGLYFGFTVIMAILLKICGMDVIDSISYAFSTLGTGGFATRNNSIASYNSVSIEVVTTVFMFLAGINFSLYFYILTRKGNEVKKNTEFKTYVLIFFLVLVCITLALIPYYGSIATALRYASFQVGAIMTTSGYATADYTQWPSVAQFFLFLLFFIGGSAGSTAGGFKVIRWVVLAKQARNEMLHMLHPHGIFTVRLNGKPGRKDLVFNVAAFTFVYFALTFVTTFIGTLHGLDIQTAFTASLSMIGNVGPAFGALGPTDNYGWLPASLKWWYSLTMIAGRLELYNILIFFLPDYWKK